MFRPSIAGVGVRVNGSPDRATLTTGTGKAVSGAGRLVGVLRPTGPKLVFGAVLAVNLIMTYLVIYRFNLFVTDATSRTLHAWQVFFSANPKLAAVGFIWAPLPTLLQVPLVLIPALRVDGLSGNVLTAFMGATTAVGLYLILGCFRLATWFRWATVVVWALNPMVLFYSSNGMSEMTFVAFTVLSIYFLLRWYENRGVGPLMLMGITVGLALLARYDTFFHAVGLLFVLWLLIGDRQRRMASGSESPTESERSRTAPRQQEAREVEGVAIAYFLPVMFAGSAWLLANMVIMGDPLHFARGPYSNAAQIGYQLALLPYLLTLIGRPDRILLFMMNQVSALYPAFVAGFVFVVTDFLMTRNRLALSLAVLALSFPAFQALNFYTGQTAAFLRYFILAIPWGIIMVGYLVGRTRATSGRRALVGMAAVTIMAASSVSSGAAMVQGAEWGQWNDKFMEALLTGERIDTWAEERQIAAYITEHVDKRDVLVDDFTGYRIMFFSRKPWLFVATGDDDFRQVLDNPVGRVNYILSYTTKLEGSLSQINIRYPDIYEEGADWLQLEGSWPGSGWKLYRVVPPSQQLAAK